MISKFFEVTIGLRYLRAKKGNNFISFISLVSILGISLGVATLIIVLSVMNGFQKEIRGRILNIASQVEVSDYRGQVHDWQNLAKKISKQPHVIASAPFISGQVLLPDSGSLRGAMIRGINPRDENRVIDLNKHIVGGALQNLQPGKFGIVLGSDLAEQLGAQLGDKVTLITPQGNVTPAGMIPRMKQFTVVGLFKIGMYQYDNGLAMIDLHDAQVLFRLDEGNVSGVRLKLDDAMLAPQIKETIINANKNALSSNNPDIQASALGENIRVSDWTDANKNYFRAVQIEKRMMFLILTMIVAVAAFNLVSTLFMVVTDKRADIAILRTLGASPASIMRIFVIQGSIAGIFGTLTGVLGGVLIAKNLDVIVPVIESIIGSKILSKQVYMIDYLPSDVQLHDVLTIIIISLALSLLATLYPSYSAAKSQPAEALRYE